MSTRPVTQAARAPHEERASAGRGPAPSPTPGTGPGSVATMLRELAAIRWTCLGILAGHVWSWGAVHAAGMTFPGLHTSTAIYLALSAFLALVALAAATLRPSELVASRADAPVAVASAVGSLLLCAPLPGLSPQTQVVLGALLGGIGIGGSYLQWAYFYSRLSTKASIACVFGAMLVGSLVKIPVDLLPPVPCAVACALLCVASPVMKRDAVRHQLAGDPALTCPAPEPTYTSLREARPLGKAALGVVAYSLVIGIMQGMTIVAAPMPKLVLSGVHHLAEVAVALVVLWYVLGGARRSISFSAVWKSVLVFTGAGVMALPLVGPLFTGWALIAVAVAQTLVVMLLWATLAEVSRRCPASPLVVFGLGWMAYSLPFALGCVVGAALERGGSGDAVIGLIVYLLALSTVFFLNERDFSRGRLFSDLEGEALPTSMDEPVRASCKSLSARSGLTDREEEVMYLICVGRSKGYIAETLSISENTVRSHSRHLYAKLGVHSKQELLDLVLEGAGSPFPVTGPRAQ